MSPSDRLARLRAAVSLVIACLLVVDTSAAQTWTRADGPGGADVIAIAIDPWTPSTIYVGTTHGGAFKSTDGGEHWTQIGLTGLVRVADFAIDTFTPTTVYAATTLGVMKSSDAGQTWSTVLDGDFLHLAMDPWMPSTVYAARQCCFPSAIAKTTDGGDTWIGVGDDIVGSISSLVIDLVDSLDRVCRFIQEHRRRPAMAAFHPGAVRIGARDRGRRLGSADGVRGDAG